MCSLPAGRQVRAGHVCHCLCRAIAQLVVRRAGGPEVASSSLAGPTEAMTGRGPEIAPAGRQEFESRRSDQ